jgi:predicted TIM-barrel fold metal-dependent hydrolase
MEAEWSTDDPVAETDWLHRVAEADGVPSAIIGQAWFCRDDIDTVLAGHAAYPLIRGIRQKPVAAATQDQVISGAPGTMSDPKFREGYAIMAKHSLHYDLQVPWWHLEEARDLARDFPDTPIILNHTGLPSDRSERSLLGWRAGMEALADVANTAVKISGIGMPGEAWTVELNRNIVLTTIAIFGVERCMFASNFPVDSLVASYDTIFDGFREITKELGQSAQRKLFHDNAKRYYRIDT